MSLHSSVFVQYLCCLSTSRSSTDKLAFDVGLQEDTTGTAHLKLLINQFHSFRVDTGCVCVCVCVGEACWWTIHPASKQRSEGEKVRVGDDLILVSVSSERYLVSH